VSADGQRFLIARSENARLAESAPERERAVLVLVRNFFEELDRLVPN
jgi:hypothetical protein